MGELETGKEQNLFLLPDDPEEFGAFLTPTRLRNIDFTALDFQRLQRSGVEYIKTYFPSIFNDFVASNGVIMFLELVSAIGNTLAQREDILNEESFLPTSRSIESVSEHLTLISQSIQRATPAVTDVECSVGAPSSTEVRVPAATSFSLTGPDNNALFYEIFRSPSDFVSDISIPPGKRGVIAFGVEGRFGTPVVISSPGGPRQFIDIGEPNVIDEPIFVTVQSGDEVRTWRRVSTIEKAASDDEVFQVIHTGEITRILFGDDINGKAPLAGETVTVRFRLGGGTRGRIGSGIINQARPFIPELPLRAAVQVTFRNIGPSRGGENQEEVDDAKKRAPREFGAHENVVSGEDYGVISSTFSHPTFGSVLKAVSALRSGIDADPVEVVNQIKSATSIDEAVDILLNNCVNRNIVEVYTLSDTVDGPTAPNAGLKLGLNTALSDINVFTDEVRVLDGKVKAVDVEATVIVSRSADAGTVKVDVQAAITDFFDIKKFDMGEGLKFSQLNEAIQNVPGVSSVSIFKPADNIIPSSEVVDDTTTGDDNTVGINELLVLGNVNLRFFFEKGSFAK